MLATGLSDKMDCQSTVEQLNHLSKDLLFDNSLIFCRLLLV